MRMRDPGKTLRASKRTFPSFYTRETSPTCCAKRIETARAVSSAVELCTLPDDIFSLAPSCLLQTQVWTTTGIRPSYHWLTSNEARSRLYQLTHQAVLAQTCRLPPALLKYGDCRGRRIQPIRTRTPMDKVLHPGMGVPTLHSKTYHHFHAITASFRRKTC